MSKPTFTLWETLAHYRAWNTAKHQETRRKAGQKPPEQKWQEYLNLMELGMTIKPQPSLHEQRQKWDVLNRYYAQLQRFEARRTSHEE
jgi:hypothetical protein